MSRSLLGTMGRAWIVTCAAVGVAALAIGCSSSRATPSLIDSGSGGVGSNGPPETSSGGAPDAAVKGGGGHLVTGDAAAQDDYCFSPCVWQVLKNCLPVFDECFTSSDGALGSVTCDPSSGWTESTKMVALHSTRFTVAHDGVDCYEVESSFIPFGPSGSSYMDGNGKLLGSSVNSGPLYCGATLIEVANAQMSGAAADPGGFPVATGTARAYPRRSALPQCAAIDKYGMPVQPACKNVDGGVCPSSM